MKRIVVLSRRDLTHPLSGGAGRYIHEIFRRLTARYSITVLAEGGPAREPVEEIDGITYRHFSGKLQRMSIPMKYVTRFAGETDLLVDNADVAIPWLSPFYSKVPRIVVIYQVAGSIFHHELARPLSEIAIRLEPRIYRLYRNTEVVTCSPSTRDDLTQLGLSQRKVTIIAPGIDDSFRRFEPDGRKFDNPTIVCISRFRRYKGLSYAVRSMKFILDRVPTAKLVIVGNGDPSELKEEISKTGYPESIEVLERAPETWNAEKRFLLSRSHLLLIPSVREGYGIVVIEANACGTPAIGWAVPGVQDSIVDGKTGLLVPFGDTRRLGETIAKLLESDSPQLRNMTRPAIEWARQHSWDTAAEMFANAIDSER
jgi:glycosyltransferase involved in cell wall biosynthesis